MHQSLFTVLSYSGDQPYLSGLFLYSYISTVVIVAARLPAYSVAALSSSPLFLPSFFSPSLPFLLSPRLSPFLVLPPPACRLLQHHSLPAVGLSFFFSLYPPSPSCPSPTHLISHPSTHLTSLSSTHLTSPSYPAIFFDFDLYWGSNSDRLM